MQVHVGAILTLQFLTLVDGAAPGGGAILNSGTLTVTNSTFDNNSGGGGDAVLNEGPTASLKGTILAASTVGNCLGTITDAGYNLSDDDSCTFSATGSQNHVSNIDLASGLANNGGPTETIALLFGSAAIDQIPIASCTDASGKQLTTDQRGALRPDAGEVSCDIGAYESGAVILAGQPGKANCHGKSVSALAQQYGGLDAAASALGYSSVQALQDAIRTFCGGKR